MNSNSCSSPAATKKGALSRPQIAALIVNDYVYFESLNLVSKLSEETKEFLEAAADYADSNESNRSEAFEQMMLEFFDAINCIVGMRENSHNRYSIIQSDKYVCFYDRTVRECLASSAVTITAGAAAIFVRCIEIWRKAPEYLRDEIFNLWYYSQLSRRRYQMAPQSLYEDMSIAATDITTVVNYDTYMPVMSRLDRKFLNYADALCPVTVNFDWNFSAEDMPWLEPDQE